MDTKKNYYELGDCFNWRIIDLTFHVTTLLIGTDEPVGWVELCSLDKFQLPTKSRSGLKVCAGGGGIIRVYIDYTF